MYAFFCRSLHNYIKDEFPDEQIGFMDPAQTNSSLMEENRGTVLQYIRTTIQENREKRLIFIPYHQLLVLHINISNFIIFLLIHINYRI